MSFLKKKKWVIKSFISLFLVLFLFGFYAVLFLNMHKTKAASDSRLYFNPASQDVSLGQSFNLSAMINPGTNKVSAIEIYVTFDPTKFSLTSITPPTASNCASSPQMSQVLSSANINNVNGTASIILGVCMNSPVVYITNVSTVATFSFQSLGLAQSSPIAFSASSQCSAENEPGNVIVSRTGSLISVKDFTAPSVSAFVIPASSVSLTVPISTFTAADNVAVTGYRLTESSAAPFAGDVNWSSQAPTSYLFSTEGNKTLYAWAKDAAGNISASRNDAVSITLPKYSIGGTISGLVGTVQLMNNGGNALSRNTNGSFVFSTLQTSGSAYNVTVSSQPTGRICQVSNGAGTISNVNIINIGVSCADTGAPVVSGFNIPDTSISLTVPISTFTATDNTAVTGYKLTETSFAPLASDNGWTSLAPTTYSFSTEGIKRLYAWAKDAANNVSASLNDSVVISLPRYPGDLNQDSHVDIMDYALFISNFGKTNCGNTADLNKDCLVNIFDYSLFIADFGK